MHAQACAALPAQGAKRTKLGLREFVKLGDFTQSINTKDSLAVSSRISNAPRTACGSQGRCVQLQTPRGAKRVAGCACSAEGLWAAERR